MKGWRKKCGRFESLAVSEAVAHDNAHQIEMT
jgi:hypothetical protein